MMQCNNSFHDDVLEYLESNL